MGVEIHQGQPVLELGDDPREARLTIILLHGRGAHASSMAPLADALYVKGSRFLVPQAAYNRWYPGSAFAPLGTNEPDLSSALALIEGLVQGAHEAGFSDRQIVLGGFSQGACLAGEYAARNAARYGGLFMFSGALIGPAGTARDYPGSFAGMPAFVGGSDSDPWVAHELLSETADVLERMGAEVDFRTYPGMGHTVHLDEVEHTQEMLAGAMKSDLGQSSG